MSARYTYDNGDFLIEFAATTSKNDYGVRGSPVWDEIEDISVEMFAINDVEIDLRDLPKAVIAALIGIAENLEGDEWTIYPQGDE